MILHRYDYSITNITTAEEEYCPIFWIDKAKKELKQKEDFLNVEDRCLWNFHRIAVPLPNINCPIIHYMNMQKICSLGKLP